MKGTYREYLMAHSKPVSALPCTCEVPVSSLNPESSVAVVGAWSVSFHCLCIPREHLPEKGRNYLKCAHVHWLRKGNISWKTNKINIEEAPLEVMVIFCSWVLNISRK